MIKQFKKIQTKLKNELVCFKDKDHLELYRLGLTYSKDEFYRRGAEINTLELNKSIYRYDIINHILSTFKRPTVYLEIGVRYLEDNFNKIEANTKYSVDPGVENSDNPVDFKVTSDVFFNGLESNKLLDNNTKFDVIFIDGLHLAEQVERDIENALKFLNDDGFIVLHDCNPPTEFHASETYEYRLSPSKDFWNGTTWKAFFKYRQNPNLFSCCIDTDWGVGIISRSKNIGEPTKIKNAYFEYKVFSSNRKESLNLMSFNDFKLRLK
ncbi:methyltransferase family protein [Algibacter lectus]|uniref:Methyltransferase family protein n=1 Tax=Algibacter lectus TaxID=221126 RepID=A0A4R8MIC6_9FLAO|nr:methyltransferase family protein [Algibacter lectus]